MATTEMAPKATGNEDNERNPLWPDDIAALDALAHETGDPVSARRYALGLAEGPQGEKGRTIEVTDPDTGKITHIPVVSIGKAAVKPKTPFLNYQNGRDVAYEQAQADSWRAPKSPEDSEDLEAIKARALR